LENIMAVKKAQSGKAASGSTEGKKPNALQKPLQPSKELAAVVGSEPLARGEVVSRFRQASRHHPSLTRAGLTIWPALTTAGWTGCGA
jgi:hypothetical protein